MVLGRQVHVVVSERFLLRRRLKPLILCTTKQVQRIPPDFALWDGWGGGARGLGRVAAAQPRRDVVERDLLDKRHAIAAVVPPLKDEDESGYEGRGAGQRNIELGGQRRQEHGRHAEVFTYFQWSAQIEYDKRDLGIKIRSTVLLLLLSISIVDLFPSLLKMISNFCFLFAAHLHTISHIFTRHHLESYHKAHAHLPRETK